MALLFLLTPPCDAQIGGRTEDLERIFGPGGTGGIMGESDTNSPSQASLQASAEENLRKNEHWERQARKKTAMLNDEMPAGELAVARGLKWLKEHQYKNGAWNFDHRAAPPV